MYSAIIVFLQCFDAVGFVGLAAKLKMFCIRDFNSAYSA